jgi:hypothetical protein
LPQSSLKTMKKNNMIKSTKKRETMTKIYMSDEDKMMRDKNLKWSEPTIINHINFVNNNDIKLNYQSIGDCYYDIYCQPELTSKDDLLKDMVKILNGELTIEDFKNEIKQWHKERQI